LNFDVELRFDFTVDPLWPGPLILTVRPKSGISKFLSYNCAYSKLVNKFKIFGF